MLSRHGVPLLIKTCGDRKSAARRVWKSNRDSHESTRRYCRPKCSPHPMARALARDRRWSDTRGEYFLKPRSPTPQTSRSSSPPITAPEKSIAVLPFSKLNPNKNERLLCGWCSGRDPFQPRQSIPAESDQSNFRHEFRPGSNRDLRSIARVLGVARVLEGTVRREGNRVRITAELDRCGDGKTLWSESYDRELTDIFAIQSEIAQTVVAKLSARLSPEEKRTCKKSLPKT